MNIAFVDLDRQYREIREDALNAIVEVLDSMNLYLGPNVEAFEAEYARYCGTEFAIGVGSGTEALHLALLACRVGHGDEVITVSNTFFATIEAIALAGATPVFIDVHERTHNMDTDQIEGSIGSRTRAIMPVHLYGNPADMDPILALARAHGLKVIEDACQAHGAEHRGHRAGCLGDVGCFSFYCAKNLGAYGEAGMVVTSDPDIADRCRMLRDHGQLAKYYHSVLGVNSRLDEVQAAVLRVKLPHLDKWNQERRDIARAYGTGLPASITRPVEMPWAKHVYHLYVIRSQARESLRSYLQHNGVATGIHYPIPVHLQAALRGNGRAPASLPATERLSKEVLSLPVYPGLTADEVGYVCDLITDFHSVNAESR